MNGSAKSLLTGATRPEKGKKRGSQKRSRTRRRVEKARPPHKKTWKRGRGSLAKEEEGEASG